MPVVVWSVASGLCASFALIVFVWFMSLSAGGAQPFLKTCEILLQQLRIVVAHGLERCIVSPADQFILQRLHEDSRFVAQSVRAVVNGATGTAWVAAHDGHERASARYVALDAVGRLYGQCLASASSVFAFECLAQALSSGSSSFEAECDDFRAGDLQDADVVLMAPLQQLEIHCRRTRRAGVPRILVEHTFDDGHETVASCVSGRPAHSEPSFQCGNGFSEHRAVSLIIDRSSRRW